MTTPAWDGPSGAAKATLRQRSQRAHPDATSSPAATPRAAAGRGTPDSDRAASAVDLTALLRQRYYAHLCTQMLSSDLPAFTFLAGTVLSPRDALRGAERAFGLFLLLLVSAHAAASLAFPLRRLLPARLRAADDATAVGRALLMDWLANTMVTPVLFAAFMWRAELRAANCPAAAGLGGCGLAYIGTLNLSRSFRPVVAQVPPRLAFAYEVARAALNAACGLVAYALDGALRARDVAAVLGASVAALAFTLVLIALHHDPLFSDADHLPAWLDLWPARARPAREALLRRLSALAARVQPAPLDYRVMCGLNLLGNTLAGVLQARDSPLATFGANGRIVLHVYLTLSLTAAASGALSGGGAATLGDMTRRLGLDAERRLVDEVRVAVAEAGSEEEALRGAAAALRTRLFPAARTLALRLQLADDVAPLVVTLGRSVDADGVAAAVVAEEDAADSGSSRAFVTAQDRCLIADSRDFPAGLASFSDWARAGGAGAEVAVTAPLPAGPALLGTLVACFAPGGAPTHYEQPLLRCCRTIGEGLFARREAATSSATSALASDLFPKHCLERLLERSRRASDGGGARLSLGDGSGRRRSRSSIVSCASVASAAALEAPAECDATSASPPPPPPPPPPEEDDGAASPPRDPADAMRRRLSARLSRSGLGPASPFSAGGADPDADVDAGLFYHECHECVSVVFVDLVDFTPLAESQDALATMQMLHALFCRFDQLCESLGVYKVETVGDCYMAAAGLLSPAKAGSARRHAAAAALFALRAHDAAAACGLRVRAGLHAGPVTSGLVGRLRARFCLFGDVVNTASRLEAAGVPGCVQLSRSAAHLAGLPDALCPAPRALLLKGKAAPLDTYLLRAASAEAQQAEAVLEAQLQLYDDE